MSLKPIAIWLAESLEDRSDLLSENASKELRRLSELELDAKRYRWLRDNGGFQEGRKSRGVAIAKDELKSLMSFGYWVTPEELDAAIDAKIDGKV